MLFINLKTINHGQRVGDRDVYVRNLITAKNDLLDAEEALEAHLEFIEFLEEELSALKQD